MGILQDSADLPGGRSAGYPSLPPRGQTDPADVLLDAKYLAEGIHRPRGSSEGAAPSSPVDAVADSGLANIAKTTPDLVPTTLRMMGNAVYLHTPTGKVLMEVGNLSPSELGTKLGLGSRKAIGNEAGRPASSEINLVNNNEDQLTHAIEDASIIRDSQAQRG